MNIRNTTDLGTVIRARRKELKVSQRELAMICGTGVRFIIEVEQGKATCQVGKVIEVINALGMNIKVPSPGSGDEDVRQA